MKLALVSDLHGQSICLRNLKEVIKLNNPDGIIISGDISSGDTDYIDILFEIFRAGLLEAFIICGNADVGDCQRMIDQSEYSINQKCKSFGKAKICGLCDHEEFLSSPGEIAGSIFVSHRPPVKSLIDKKLDNAPLIHISGHLHTREFTKQYPSTKHIQIPTLQSGKYALLDVDSGDVEFLTI
ncbi:MAG: metallophosphoesterase [bacterium]